MSNEVKSKLQEAQGEEGRQFVSDSNDMIVHCRDVAVKMEIKDEPYIQDGIFTAKTSVSCSEARTSIFTSEVAKENINYDTEVDTKIEIKEEYWWLETTEPECQDYSISDVNSENQTKNTASSTSYGTVSPTETSRLYTEARECEDDVTKCLETPENKNKYECGICMKSFRYIWSLKEHCLLHTDGEPYECETCGKSFTCVFNFSIHLLKHNDNRPHKCEICEKSFKHLCHLRKHILLHDASRQYKCEICEKSCNRLYNLRKHMLIHEDIRSHKCEICEKSFKNLGFLKKHIVVHDGTRLHKCEICEKTYKHLGFLRKHIVVHDETGLHKCE